MLMRIEIRNSPLIGKRLAGISVREDNGQISDLSRIPEMANSKMSRLTILRSR